MQTCDSYGGWGSCQKFNSCCGVTAAQARYVMLLQATVFQLEQDQILEQER